MKWACMGTSNVGPFNLPKYTKQPLIHPDATTLHTPFQTRNKELDD